MICPNCKKYYNDAHLFCPFCKTKKPLKVCPKCGEIGEDEDNFCTMCGSKLIKIDYEKNILKEKLNDFKEANKRLQIETQELKEQEEKQKKELNKIKQTNEKLKTEKQELKQLNAELENERKLSLQNYLNSNYIDSKYDKIRKYIFSNIKNGKITSKEQIDAEIERLEEEEKLKIELEKYFYENFDRKWENKIIIKIRTSEIITKKQIETEIQILEEEDRLKLEKQKILIKYVNQNLSIPNKRKLIIKKIKNGEINKIEQIDKEIRIIEREIRIMEREKEEKEERRNEMYNRTARHNYFKDGYVEDWKYMKDLYG